LVVRRRFLIGIPTAGSDSMVMIALSIAAAVIGVMERRRRERELIETVRAHRGHVGVIVRGAALIGCERERER
jgi:hypothetical protein